ncbi:hypothetical protein FGO68_gene12733 [Halteria grandinella]|uniref:Uncharacterized protein n=1 Tax=Halteria grandinella TaxID=5974 RepID=A0A8J8NE48_HALGN|nr:hypothetical protein FGO68_gene12733 [Halteria grandinella]
MTHPCLYAHNFLIPLALSTSFSSSSSSTAQLSLTSSPTIFPSSSSITYLISLLMTLLPFYAFSRNSYSGLALPTSTSLNFRLFIAALYLCANKSQNYLSSPLMDLQ